MFPLVVNKLFSLIKKIIIVIIGLVTRAFPEEYPVVYFPNAPSCLFRGPFSDSSFVLALKDQHLYNRCSYPSPVPLRWRHLNTSGWEGGEFLGLSEPLRKSHRYWAPLAKLEMGRWRGPIQYQCQGLYLFWTYPPPTSGRDPGECIETHGHSWSSNSRLIPTGPKTLPLEFHCLHLHWVQTLALSIVKWVNSPLLSANYFSCVKCKSGELPYRIRRIKFDT